MPRGGVYLWKFMKIYLFTISHCILQPIDYEGFALFMRTYLDADLDEIFKHLFLSFMKKPGPPEGAGGKQAGMLGKDLQGVAATACAAVMPGEEAGTALSAASTMSSIGRNLGGSIAASLQGISDRIHQLGHSRHDSGGGGDSGKRSRAGTHPLCASCTLTYTRARAAFTPLWA